VTIEAAEGLQDYKAIGLLHRQVRRSAWSSKLKIAVSRRYRVPE